MDLVYVVRPGDRNEELRYSLRSVARNLPHGRVWIAGHRPAWVAPEVEAIETEQAGTKYENSSLNLLAACRHPEISSPFLLMNDDFFATEPALGDPPTYHRGPVAEVLAASPHGGTLGRYQLGARATAELLAREYGITEPLSYEVHAPMPIYGGPMAELIEAHGPGSAGEVVGLHKRTLYGNLTEAGGVRIGRDPKIKSDSELRKLGMAREGLPAPWVSTNDRIFATGEVGRRLRAMFAEPCQYERDDPRSVGSTLGSLGPLEAP